MKFIYLSLFSVLFSLSAFAQRKYSNEFLNIGVGSRAFGMSGAVAASTNDVYSGFWNPAGLTQMSGNAQVGLMHSEYFAGIAKYDFGGFATAIDNTSYVGLSVIRFGVDDIPDTSELIDADGNINYNKVKSFSTADYAFLLSYARKVKGKNSTISKFSYGVNAKIIHRKVGSYGKAWGFGIDAGAQYRLKKFTFALMAKDITTTFNGWSYTAENLEEVFLRTDNDIPVNSLEITLPSFILGTAYSSPITKKVGITAEINMKLTTDGPRNVLLRQDNQALSLDPNAGIELDYAKIVYLRGGVGNIQRGLDFEDQESFSFQPNIGLGIKISNFSIDYALTNIGNTSDALYSNVFSLRLDIIKKKRPEIIEPVGPKIINLYPTE